MEDAKLLSALPVPNAELHQPQDAALKPRFGRTAEDSDRANRNGCDDDGDGWVRVTAYSALLFSPLLNGPLNREDELFFFFLREGFRSLQVVLLCIGPQSVPCLTWPLWPSRWPCWRRWRHATAPGCRCNEPHLRQCECLILEDATRSFAARAVLAGGAHRLCRVFTLEGRRAGRHRLGQ